MFLSQNPAKLACPFLLPMPGVTDLESVYYILRVVEELVYLDRLVRQTVIFKCPPELLVDGVHERVTSHLPLFCVANLAQP